MGSKEKIVSVLHALTSNEFLPSNLTDNSALEMLVTEYFGGNDDTDDDESSPSKDEELRMFTRILWK